MTKGETKGTFQQVAVLIMQGEREMCRVLEHSIKMQLFTSFSYNML